MRPIIRNILLPAIIPLLFFVVAAMPVEILGCRNRGLLAAIIALAGALAGLGAAIIGLRRRMRGDPHSRYWAATILILSIPAVAILYIAYAR